MKLKKMKPEDPRIGREWKKDVDVMLYIALESYRTREMCNR